MRMASALLARGTSVSRQLVLLVLLAAACVLGAGAALRSTEYDETYTRLVTSPVPRASNAEAMRIHPPGGHGRGW